MTEPRTTPCKHCGAPVPVGATVHQEINSQGTTTIATLDGAVVHTCVTPPSTGARRL